MLIDFCCGFCETNEWIVWVGVIMTPVFNRRFFGRICFSLPDGEMIDF